VWTDFIRAYVIDNRTGWPTQKLCSLFYGAVPNIWFCLAFSEVLQVDYEWWQGNKKEESLPVCKTVMWSGCKMTCLKFDLPSLILCKWRKFGLCHNIIQNQVGRALLKGKITGSLTCLFICCKFNIIASTSHFITVSDSGSMSRMRSNMYCIYCQIEISVCRTHVLQKL